MGLTFRKSIKIGKNTRLNLSSKGGIGISTGVKGARVSINKQGAKLYGGKGAIRYQKQLYSNNKNSNSNNYIESNESYQSHNYNKRNSINPISFLKKYYKEIISVIIGITIGSSVSGAGKVSTYMSQDVTNQIESNKSIIDTKKSELESLQNKKSQLEIVVDN